MTFNESEVRRDNGGRFDHKEGSASDIELPVTRAQKISDLTEREPFPMYAGRETELENGDILTWMEENDVKGTAVYLGQRYADDGRGSLQHRYSVTLERDGKTMQTPYFTGTAWEEAPSAASVIETLVLDAQLHSEGKRNYRSMMEGSGTPAFEVDRQYAKLASQAHEFRDFAGDDYARLTGTESHDELR